MRLPHLPAELPTSSTTILRDTREQHLFEFPGFRTEAATLRTGDYSVKGLQDSIALERKSLGDFLSCCASERERFEAELQRMLSYPARAVVCEFGWSDLQGGNWRSKVRPESAIGSVIGWQALGIPFLLSGDRATAQDHAARFLYTAARREWRRLRTFAAGHWTATQDGLHETSTSSGTAKPEKN